MLHPRRRTSSPFSLDELPTPQSLSVPLKLLCMIAGASITAISWSFAHSDNSNNSRFLGNQGLISGILSDAFPCGHSPATAQARGYHFESYTATWQPSTCFDAELDRQFRELKPWKFYADKNGTTELTFSDVENGLDQVWTAWDFHFTQCAWFWKKEVKIGNGAVSGTIDSHQCLDMALMQDYMFSKEKIVKPYWPRFSSCRPPSDISIHQFALTAEGVMAMDVKMGGHDHVHGPVMNR